ncbi:MAG: peptidase S8 [Planctomycetes bacterium]|nr:peptidase S8 [Planctomycetota bacterium]
MVALTISTCAWAQGDAHIGIDPNGHQLVIADTGLRTANVHETKYPVLQPVLRTVPDSSIVAVTWSEQQPSGLVDYYSISLDGKTFLPAKATNYVLKLRFGEYDPMQGIPGVPPHLDANQGGNLWIVQFWTQALPAYRDALRDLGASVHMHLWNHSNVVEMSPAMAAAVQAMPHVRAVVAYHPAFKLDETLLQEQIAGYAAQDPKQINVVSLRRGLAAQNPIADRIRAMGAPVHATSPGVWQIRSTLSLAQVAELARRDDVQWIEIESPGRYTADMDIAKVFHGSTYVFNNAGFDGTGVRGEICDTGTQASHPEFQAIPLIPHGVNNAGSHGTSTYGQIFASGVNAQAKGICPNGQGIANQYQNWAGGSEYNHTSQLSNPALQYRAVFQTFSGFTGLTTTYNSGSQTADQILFDNSRMTMTQSQSNTGNQNSRSRAWGKNCVAVGGISHGNTLTKADDAWTGASVGPASDGRVKPELASFYDNIFTTTTTSNYTSGFGGTSGATPIVAGHFGIFYQMWHNGIFNNPTSTSVFDSRPENTTARAMIVASATQWPFSGGASNIHRDRQGWGHPDLQRLYDNRLNLLYINETDVLAPLSSTIHVINVSSGEPEFRATLCWRDNPGTLSGSQHLINDMDLRVTSPSGMVYWGNNGMTNGVSGSAGENEWTSVGGSPDTTNSLENVFVQNPQAGPWLVEVIASNINQDNHVETGALDADYALCVIGGPAGPPTFFNLDLQTNGNGDIFFEVQNIPAGTNQGWCLFSSDTSGPQGGGAVFGLYPDFLTLQTLISPLAAGNPLHWSYPAAGLFPDVPFSLPAGSLPPAFFPLDGVAIATDPGFASVSSSPVRRVN